MPNAFFTVRHYAHSKTTDLEDDTMDREIALWLLSCTCATYEDLRSKKSAPVGEVRRHRAIIEKAYGALMNTSPMPPRSMGAEVMEHTLDRARGCLDLKPANEATTMIPSEDVCRRTAHIVGESSAAGRALAELERRRAAGETVEVFLKGETWIVGPPLPEDEPAGPKF